ncbi:hypothetical protein Tsubulata_045966 [Turnera subulata]|uniref:Uncharacterized protein n=1 Tax=Turnera subulata TaxID=218843 RepID=A0A9Q0J0X8_9ROSI|nr:hypothetical protein Tsubulata_045966 [Turnera subulata]
MAKIAYASLFLVVVLLSMPSILNAESLEDVNSISVAPSDSMIEPTTMEVDEEADQQASDSWFNWIFDFMGGEESEAAGAPAPQPEYAEYAEAPAFAPSSWTLRHL